ncbi:MAG: hypothetical protein JWN91_3672 [Nocardioides sp.]|jgi:hypothetical protein|nr:hypothetical protein [Nocardioides sp.]
MESLHVVRKLMPSYLITDQDTPAQRFYESHGFGTTLSRIVMTRSNLPPR